MTFQWIGLAKCHWTRKCANSRWPLSFFFECESERERERKREPRACEPLRYEVRRWASSTASSFPSHPFSPLLRIRCKERMGFLSSLSPFLYAYMCVCLSLSSPLSPLSFSPFPLQLLTGTLAATDDVTYSFTSFRTPAQLQLFPSCSNLIQSKETAVAAAHTEHTFANIHACHRTAAVAVAAVTQFSPPVWSPID